MDDSLWRRWRHAVVRDLAWVLASPPLLQPPWPEAVWPDAAWGLRAWQASADWLAALDRDPAPLQAALAWRPGRLGGYFEALLAAWLAWPSNPLYRLLHHGLPVRRQRRTLGELDFLVAAPADATPQHWEVAVKFYLGTAPGGDHAAWVGPGLKDRLDLKVARLRRHQLGLSRRPEAALLLAGLGLPPPAPLALLRGRFFYPLGARPAGWAPAQAAPDHLQGWWGPTEAFRAEFGTAGLDWIRLPREHWLAPVDLHQPDPAVRIGDCRRAPALLEALAAAAENRAAAVVGLADGREVTRGFITPDHWPAPPAT